MSKSPRAPRATQDQPTEDRPRDTAGRVLDQHGLPLNGPARVRRLAELGRPDPNDDPAAWERQPAPSAAVSEESDNG